MKIIDKSNFFSNVCIAYTITSIAKIIIEFISWGKFGLDQKNYIAMFFICCAAIFVLSQQYRFSRLPLWLVFIGQYILMLGGVMLFVWISGFFEDLHPNGYWHMFRSFTVCYLIGAAVYYAELYKEIRKANFIIQNLNKK